MISSWSMSTRAPPPTPIVVPNGWTKGEGAGTLSIDAAITKAQRDVLRGGCVQLTLMQNPLES